MDIIASSSKGNCYRFGDILVECGIPISDILRGCNFAAPVACLVTHEHKDHSLAAMSITKMGVPIIASAGTLRKLKIVGPVLKHMVPMRVGDTTVLPFNIEHDAAEPMGFVLARGQERVLFATDCIDLPYQFNGLTELFVECNYSEEILLASSLDDEARRRIAQNHMSLDRLLSFLERTDLSRVTRIVLLHLSDGHSDEQLFKKAVEAATGRPVTVAEK